MFKKTAFFIAAGLLLFTTSGCVALIAGGAAGAGTAVWLSEKLTQEVNAPYDRAIRAAEMALKSLDLKTTKESREDNAAQLKSVYTNGKEVWIDIHKTAENSTKIEVRVGAVSPDKQAATKILKRIQQYL